MGGTGGAAGGPAQRQHHLPGVFLLPRQFGDQPEPAVFDLRHVDLTGVGPHGYLVWRDDLAWPMRMEEVRLHPSDPARGWTQVLWPREDGDRERVWGPAGRGRPVPPSRR